MLGVIGGRRRRGWQRMRWLDGITDSMGMGLGRVRELVRDREGWRAVIHGVTKSWTRLSDWTELNWTDSLTLNILKNHGIVHLKWVNCMVCKLYLSNVAFKVLKRDTENQSEFQAIWKKIFRLGLLQVSFIGFTQTNLWVLPELIQFSMRESSQSIISNWLFLILATGEGVFVYCYSTSGKHLVLI